MVHLKPFCGGIKSNWRKWLLPCLICFDTAYITVAFIIECIDVTVMCVAAFDNEAV